MSSFIRSSKRGFDNKNIGAIHKSDYHPTPTPPPKPKFPVWPIILILLLAASAAIIQPWNVKIGSERVPYTDIRICAGDLGISPSELIAQLRQEEKGTRLIETLLEGISIDQSSPDDIDANAAAIVRDMQASGVFTDVTYDADTQTITYTYPSGVSGFISLSDTSDISGLSASGTAAGTASFSPLSSGVLNTPDKRVYIRTGSGSPSVSVLLLYAFIGDEDESTRVQLIESTINWSTVNVDLTIDTSVTLDDLCRLGGYDVVYVDTHGCTIDSNRDSGFRTNEVKSASSDLKYRVSEQKNEIRYCTGYHYGSNNITEYFVTSGFFSRNIVTAPDGLFYSGSCQFYGSDDKNAQYTYKFADTLLSLGAKAVIGFRNSVYTRYDEGLACRIITDLAQGASIGEAYDKETNYGTATDGKPASELSAFALLRGNRNYCAASIPSPEAPKTVDRSYWDAFVSSNYPNAGLAVVADVTHDNVPELILFEDKSRAGNDGVDFTLSVWHSDGLSEPQKIYSNVGADCHAGGFLSLYLTPAGNNQFDLTECTCLTSMGATTNNDVIERFYLDANGNQSVVGSSVTAGSYILYVSDYFYESAAADLPAALILRGSTYCSAKQTVPITPVPITPVPITPVPITPVPITPVPITPEPAVQPAVPAPENPQTVFGIGYRDYVLNGSYYSVDDILSLVHDTYYVRKAADGSHAPGHYSLMNKKNDYGYTFSFYYADGLLYFAEVRNPSTNETLVKLYFWGDTIYAYRDYRISDHSLHSSGSGLDAIKREFSYVLSFGRSLV